MHTRFTKADVQTCKELLPEVYKCSSWRVYKGHHLVDKLLFNCRNMITD